MGRKGVTGDVGEVSPLRAVLRGGIVAVLIRPKGHGGAALKLGTGEAMVATRANGLVEGV